MAKKCNAHSIAPHLDSRPIYSQTADNMAVYAQGYNEFANLTQLFLIL